MKGIKIHPIALLKVDQKYKKPMMTYLYNYGQTLISYFYVWLIEGVEKRIIIDAGVTGEMLVTRGKSTKEEITEFQSLEEGLKKFELKPTDIDIVILTHLHSDHIGLASQFTNAKFIVQKDELDFAKRPHLAVSHFYDRELFNELNFKVINGDRQICKGIKVLLTPGHTVGGQSVAIETKRGIAVVTGFCCIEENFKPNEEIKKSIPIIVPGIHIDVLQAYNSMVRIREAADIIIPIHEPKFSNIEAIPSDEY